MYEYKCLSIHKSIGIGTKVITRDGDDHRFLLQTKRKAADKALEQCFLKEFKAMCKNSDESELNQKKAI